MPAALNTASGIQLPFRLYGALVGAQLVSDPSSSTTTTTPSSSTSSSSSTSLPPPSSSLLQLADQVLSSPYVIDREMRTVMGDEEGHTGINKVIGCYCAVIVSLVLSHDPLLSSQPPVHPPFPSRPPPPTTLPLTPLTL